MSISFRGALNQVLLLNIDCPQHFEEVRGVSFLQDAEKFENISVYQLKIVAKKNPNKTNHIASLSEIAVAL